MFKLPTILLMWFCASAQAQSYINVNVGQADVLDDNPLARIGIEYRAGENELLNLTPTVGVVFNTGGSKYIYTQLMYNFRPADAWRLSPSFGPALGY